MVIDYSFCVDAGCIAVADKDWVESKGGINNNLKLNPEFLVEPGKYKITLSCEDTWNGKVKKEVEIETSGKLIFGDLCYLFDDHNKWSDLLDETDYLQISNKNFHSVDTGGDGTFNFHIKLEEIE